MIKFGIEDLNLVFLSNYKSYENRPREGRTLIVGILQTTLCVVKSVDTFDRKERFGTAYDYLTECTICNPVISRRKTSPVKGEDWERRNSYRILVEKLRGPHGRHGPR